VRIILQLEIKQETHFYYVRRRLKSQKNTENLYFGGLGLFDVIAVGTESSSAMLVYSAASLCFFYLIIICNRLPR